MLYEKSGICLLIKIDVFYSTKRKLIDLGKKKFFLDFPTDTPIFIDRILIYLVWLFQ